jgi:TnpA family transposase
MPVDFLSDEQAAAYGRYTGTPSKADLERFFFLDGDDLALIATRRGDRNRLGFALQATTVRYLGVFLTDDPIDAPWPVIEYLAGQLGIADPSCVKRYSQRAQTVYEHSWDIREAFGYSELADGPKGPEFRDFLEGRAWTRTEGPATMFTHAVAWLRGNRVLLPGITVLTRMVAQVRDEVADRQHALLSEAAQATDSQLPQRLVQLLEVEPGHRHSTLQELAQGPKRVSGSQAAAAIGRVDRLIAIGGGNADVSAVPANKLAAMARYGLHSKAALKDVAEPRRTATLVASVQALEASAADDAIDLFMLLMTTKLINPARKKADGARLAAMPHLEAASAVLAATHQALAAVLEDPDVVKRGTLTVTQAWAAIEQVAPREQVQQAVATVEELVPDDAAEASAAEAALRTFLVQRYVTVRPFIKALGEAEWLHAAPGGARLLKEIRRLPALAARKVKAEPLIVKEVERSLVPKPWFRAVYANTALPDGAVDRDAYVLCLLEQLHAAIRVRDVFAAPSVRYADPRAKLLDGAAWAGVKDRVLAGLGLASEADTHLTPQVEVLDAAWRHTQARLVEAGDDARVRLVAGADGRAELKVTRPPALGAGAADKAVRSLVASMMPRIDLPDLLLEVDSWTGFLSKAYLNPAGRRPNLEGVDLSIAALLVSEACNVGHTPVSSDHPALTANRLSHIEQQYMRLDNHARANELFIDHQRTIDFAWRLGGGLVASVDGLRFTVPVASIHSAPAPKYFGYKRGMTWLNAVNDQVMGIGAVVVTGAPRDSPWIIDLMLNLDGGPRPDTVITDAGSYSDMVFGLFALLGYRFCPRIADLGDARYWYAHDHGTPAPDYGNLAGLARNRIDLRKIRAQWPDMLRVTGSLITGAVRAHDLLAMLGRDGAPPRSARRSPSMAASARPSTCSPWPTPSTTATTAPSTPRRPSPSPATPWPATSFTAGVASCSSPTATARRTSSERWDWSLTPSCCGTPCISTPSSRL